MKNFKDFLTEKELKTITVSKTFQVAPKGGKWASIIAKQIEPLIKKLPEKKIDWTGYITVRVKDERKIPNTFPPRYFDEKYKNLEDMIDSTFPIMIGKIKVKLKRPVWKMGGEKVVGSPEFEVTVLEKK